MYEIVDLGTIDGYTSGAEAINDAGTVAGILTPLDNKLPTQGFIWSFFTGMQILASPGGNTEGRSINGQGQIAGIVAGDKAARWDSPGQLVVLDNSVFSYAHCINEEGSVVGGRGFPGPAMIPVMWASNGARTDFAPDPDPHSGIYYEAHGINKYAQVVGEGPFLWSMADKIQHLGTQNDQGDAKAINDSGDVAGNVNGGAAFWDGGVWRQLQTPNGMISSALALNNAGDRIVGFVQDQAGVQRAALWNNWSSPMTDLTSLVPLVRYQKPIPKPTPLGYRPEYYWQQDWILHTATGINTKGQIVGYGEHLGQKTAYRLTLVPESSQTSLGAAALLVTQILFGVVGDSGGVVLGPQGPQPWPPWGPEFGAPAFTQDALLGLAVYRAASLIENSAVRLPIQKAALEGVARLIASQVESLGRG
jgi:hypothetical protein